MIESKTNFPILSMHQFDERGDKHEIYVNTFSLHIKRHHAHVLVPHRHDFYVLVYFTAGFGFHEIDFNRYSIESGAVFFLQPGQLHHWEFTPETEGFVVLHSKQFFVDNIRGLVLDQFPFFRSKLNVSKLNITDTFKRDIGNFPKLRAEFEGQEIFKHLNLGTLLCNTYIELARIYEASFPNIPKQESKYTSKFKELESLIDTVYSQEKSIEYYADKLNLSTRHVNRICQQVANRTFTQVLTERTVLEARHLLTSSELTFTEIAVKLGYDEYSYFSKIFKQYCGMNLREFRKSRLNE